MLTRNDNYWGPKPKISHRRGQHRDQRQHPRAAAAGRPGRRHREPAGQPAQADRGQPEAARRPVPLHPCRLRAGAAEDASRSTTSRCARRSRPRSTSTPDEHACLPGQRQVPANTFFPYKMLFWADSIPAPKPDLDKAKQLLTEAGFPNGFKTDLITVSGDAAGQAQAVVIKDDLAKIGIDVTIQSFEQSTAYDQASGPARTASGMRYWTNDIIDPDEVATFGADIKGGANAFNSYWSDEAVDARRSTRPVRRPTTRSGPSCTPRSSRRSPTRRRSSRWRTRPSATPPAQLGQGLQRLAARQLQRLAADPDRRGRTESCGSRRPELVAAGEPGPGPVRHHAGELRAHPPGAGRPGHTRSSATATPPRRPKQIRKSLGLNRLDRSTQYGLFLRSARSPGRSGSRTSTTARSASSSSTGWRPSLLLVGAHRRALRRASASRSGCWRRSAGAGLLDQGTRVFFTLGYALPAFLIGVLLILVFGLKLDWFPIGGYGTGFAEPPVPPGAAGGHPGDPVLDRARALAAGQHDHRPGVRLRDDRPAQGHLRRPGAWRGTSCATRSRPSPWSSASTWPSWSAARSWSRTCSPSPGSGSLLVGAVVHPRLPGRAGGGPRARRLRAAGQPADRRRARRARPAPHRGGDPMTTVLDPAQLATSAA